jgi:hypothetical protein
MSEFGDLLKGIAATMWVVLALLVFLTLRKALAGRIPFLTKLGLTPTGVSMEFAEQKLDEAVRSGGEVARQALGQVAKQSVLSRLERNADVLSGARVLWVDDHPENNDALVDLLKRFGARVETPRSNAEALALLTGNRYDVIVSDVARDDEGAGSDLKGVELAEAVFSKWGQRLVLFSRRFDPTRLPGATNEERLAVARRVGQFTFGCASRVDEALHLILDVVERRRL